MLRPGILLRAVNSTAVYKLKKLAEGQILPKHTFRTYDVYGLFFLAGRLVALVPEGGVEDVVLPRNETATVEVLNTQSVEFDVVDMNNLLHDLRVTADLARKGLTVALSLYSSFVGFVLNSNGVIEVHGVFESYDAGKISCPIWNYGDVIMMRGECAVKTLEWKIAELEFESR